MSRLFRYRAAIALLLVMPTTGCLFRSHTVARQPALHLKEATQQQLIDFIDTQAEKIKSLQATVDIDTTVGGTKRGKVTEYKEIRGYVLLEKPAMLRLIGLMPVVRNRAFDMVSDGQQFKLWIPPKNKFVTGHNQITHVSENPMENIRPQHLYDSLLVHRIDPQNEIAVLESDIEPVRIGKNAEVMQPNYVVDVIRKGKQSWYLARKITFNRSDLLPHRQRIFDESGTMVTDATYDEIQDHDGISFPNVINIWRPVEEYSIVLHMIKLQLNEPLKSEQFALEQPPGAEAVNLDEPHSTRASDGREEKR